MQGCFSCYLNIGYCYGKIGWGRHSDRPTALSDDNLKFLNLAGQVPRLDIKSYSTERKHTSASFPPHSFWFRLP